MVGLFLARVANASENVPHRPFAMWADVPLPGQFVVGLVYEESEAYHFWAGHDDHNVRFKAAGESYGIRHQSGLLRVAIRPDGEMGIGPEHSEEQPSAGAIFQMAK